MAFLSHKVIFWILTIVTGLMHGMDITLSGGLLDMLSFLRTYFYPLVLQKRQTKLSKYCEFFDWNLMAVALMPYILGWIFGFLAIKLWTKCEARTMMRISCAFVILGEIISIVPLTFFNKSMYMKIRPLAYTTFIIGRIILGIGMAVVRQVVPIYLTKVPPQTMRNQLDVTYIVCSKLGNILGSLIVSNDFVKYNLRFGWRLGSFPMIVLAMFIFYFSTRVPKKTPVQDEQVFIENGRLMAHDAQSHGINHIRQIFSRFYAAELRINATSILFQTFIGSSTLLLFLPNFLRDTFLESNASLYCSVAACSTSIIFTLFSLFLIETLRFGRRRLLLTGCCGVILTQGVSGILALVYVQEGNSKMPNMVNVISVALMVTFVAASTLIAGPLGWLSETYPSNIYTMDTYISTNTNMSADFIFSQLFMYFLCKMGGWFFVAVGAIATVMLFFVHYFLPDTSGMSSTEMLDIWRHHWYWRRFVEGSA